MFAITVLTVACPHITLGRLNPQLKQKGDKLQGRYRVKFSDFPILRDINGSVYLIITAMDGSYQYAILSHLDSSMWGMDFAAMNKYCPHEGHQVSLLNPDIQEYICSGHGTIFDATGTYIDGPAARDLEKYPTFYTAGADEVYLELYYYNTPAGVSDDIQTSGLYLHQNLPNPCQDGTTIEYGMAASGRVLLDIYDINGNKRAVIEDGYQDAGAHSIYFDTSFLNPGVYIYRMSIGNNKPLTRRMIIQR
jgi:Rieske Fe-S protein